MKGEKQTIKNNALRVVVHFLTPSDQDQSENKCWNVFSLPTFTKCNYSDHRGDFFLIWFKSNFVSIIRKWGNNELPFVILKYISFPVNIKLDCFPLISFHTCHDNNINITIQICMRYNCCRWVFQTSSFVFHSLVFVLLELLQLEIETSAIE